MERRIVSAIEVAKLANVSQSTVSRVFTPGASVSEKTRKKVMKAAEELKYQPNALARGLITKKTNMIGLAMKDIQNPFYHEVLGLFTRKLKEKGYSVLFVYTENEEIQQEEINHFLEYNVEAIIVTDALLSSNVVTRLTANNIPVILFNRHDKELMCHSVVCDNVNAAKRIGSYVYGQGVRDAVFITGKVNTSTSRDRQNGFIDFFRDKDTDITIQEGDYTYEKSFHLTRNMIQKGHIPEVIFGANDITALGALDALKECKVEIPEKTMVIGFDDIKMSSWPNYSLSTWAQPINEMVEKAIDLVTLKDRIQEPELIKLEGKFIHRATTR